MVQRQLPLDTFFPASQAAVNMRRRDSHFSVGLMCAVLAGLILAAFWPVLQAGFISLDDDFYVKNNPFVTSGLRWSNIVWAFQDSHLGTWHPLTWLSHMLDVELYGLNPTGHHLTNLLLHIANTVLLFLLFNRWTGSPWKSFLLAAFFGLHPLRVESVAWVSERKDVLSVFFGLLTLAAYSRHAGQTEKRKGWYLWSLFFYALSLMSKPMLATLPVLLLLLDFWPLGRVRVESESEKTRRPSPALSTLHSHSSLSLPRLILEKLPFLALAVLDGVVAVWTQAQAGAMKNLSEIPLGPRSGNALVTYWLYLQRTVWPVKLAVFYPFPSPWPTWIVLAGVLGLAAISVLAVVRARRQPFFLTGWFWYLVSVTPVIGFLQTGRHGSTDRFTYWPQIGILLLVVWFAADWAKTGLARKVLASLGGIIAAILLLLTRQQAGYWISNEKLFAHAAAVTENNALAHYYAGQALAERGQITEAVAELGLAVKIQPDFGDASLKLGQLLLDSGQAEKAVTVFAGVVKFYPGLAEGHFLYGQALARLGRLDSAVEQYQAALQLNPALLEAQNNLANARQRLGQLPEAIAGYRAVLKADLNNALAHNNLAAALAASGQVSEALEEYTTAIRVRPDYAEAYFNRGNILFSMDNYAPAMADFLAALRLKPNYAKALAAAQNAVQAAAQSGQTNQLDAWQNQLKPYQSN